MDPFTVSAATLGLALVAKTVKTNLDQWEKDRSLPEALAVQDGETPLPVVAVHVHRVDLAPEFQGESLKIRIKYGAQGEDLRCDTARFSPELQEQARVSRSGHSQLDSHAFMEINSTCLFLLSSDVKPVMRIAVRKAGFKRCNVAKASFSLPHSSERCVLQLPLSGPCEEELGKVSITYEVLAVPPRDLAKRFDLVCAERQKGAYLISGAAPTLEGDSVEESSDTQ
mmetsp:Transcript_119703/g.298538  ORF Transcript_119703/g.298538 Transcript_119703/m.298538 type:complete len:226 (+) Transcript_119703:56-733(+)|eukprot:CAMPEP_0115270064 /NCGR_PEP_ID=MMETSP0270-20121206/53370_1 /TAXON_ID=71861 /ORGANISM="Scrippsiella trochoidea, Strain CCMP3099" /LENGTH=225 /DNA_ID=CAMNT_0002686339 /DNA_START=53 /DNA_END=730 /DNA_ORIENTATION=+